MLNVFDSLGYQPINIYLITMSIVNSETESIPNVIRRPNKAPKNAPMAKILIVDS